MRDVSARHLIDISAWLVLNAMRTERVQFDQLCRQNICNVWRNNAWDELLGGHAHFKVKPEEAGTFVIDLLGEAFVSAKGNVSRSAALDDKFVAILMGSHQEVTLYDNVLFGALSSALSTIPDELSVVWVPDPKDTEKSYNHFLQNCPLVAVPLSHSQRIRKIHKFFGRTPGESGSPMLVLVDKDGRTITRQGVVLFNMAETHRRMELLRDDDSQYESDTRALLQYQKTLRRESVTLKLTQKRLTIETAKLAHLTTSDITEMSKFLGKAPLPPETESALQNAEQAYASALDAVEVLTNADIEVSISELCCEDAENVISFCLLSYLFLNDSCHYYSYRIFWSFYDQVLRDLEHTIYIYSLRYLPYLFFE